MQLLPALHSGGVERGVLEINEALVQGGHRSIVISAPGPMVTALTGSGGEHISLDIGRKSLATFRHVPTVRRLIAEHQVDVLHARSRLPAWIGWRALRGAAPRPAFVTTVHGLYSVSRYSSIMARGDRVIAVSESARRYVQAHYSRWADDRLVVIPRGIDPSAFPHGYQPDEYWTQRFEQTVSHQRAHCRLLLAGRWGRRKGHMTLVRLVAALDRRGLTCVGLIAGAPRDREEQYRAGVMRRAAELGVTERLVELGQRSDMRDVYSAVDVVLSLSEKPESFGRTVLEALSIGTPVVGYDHGGVGELLQRYFPSGATRPLDFDSLVDTVADLIENRPRPDPVSGHTLESMQAQTLSLYSAVASGSAEST